MEKSVTLPLAQWLVMIGHLRAMAREQAMRIDLVKKAIAANSNPHSKAKLRQEIDHYTVQCAEYQTLADEISKQLQA